MVILLLSFIVTAGVSSPDIDQLRRAARGGDVEAAYLLGRAYRLGDAVPADAREAARWLEKAAALGHGKAGDELGLVLYQNGRGAESLRWVKAGAEHGDPRAQYTWGTILYAGKLVPANPVQARQWMQRAAKAGLPAAAEALTIMSEAPPQLQTYDVVTVGKPLRRVEPARDAPVATGWQAQLGAFSVRANAQRHGQRLASKIAPPLHIAFLQDGALTRLRVAPFPNKQAAERFCADERSRQRECLTVRSQR